MTTTVTIDLELYQKLGKVTADFSMLEGCLEVFIASLISDDKMLGRAITADLSFRNLIAILSSLYRYRVQDQKQVRKLQHLLKEIQALEKRRNDMVHSKWSEDPSTKRMIRKKLTAKFKTGLKLQVEQVSPSDMNRLANQIVFATLELLELRNQWTQENRKAAT